MHKLERLYGIIGNEIKVVKKQLGVRFNQKYLPQDHKQINAPEIAIPPAEDKLGLRTFITNNRSNISKAKKRNQLEKMNAFIAAGEEAQRRFEK